MSAKLEPGQKAPDFRLPRDGGGSVALTDFAGKKLVLYFYPKADTPGCTVESKGFRDAHAEFAARNVRIVGVSVDDCPAQKAFIEKYGLPFPLIADASKKVAGAYGVLGPRGSARRVTFLIDPDGKVAEVVDSSSPDPHLKAARARFLSP